MSRYLVFDLETTIVEKYKRKANCFINDNWVVARGWKHRGDPSCNWTYHRNHDRTSYLRIADDVTIIVGFNIKFDLMWELAQGNPDLYAFFKRGGKIWDCQYAEYLLEGQTQESQMCSLDSIVESYGGRKKIDEVKLMWEAGVNTDAIPEDLLINYLVGTPEEGRNSGDIGNTEIIFLGQVKRAIKAGQIKMIQDRMDGLLCTTDMEFRGLKIDVKEAGRRLTVLKKDLAEVDARLAEHVSGLPFEFNWGSRIQVSCLLFGGTVKYKVRDTYTDENGLLVCAQEEYTGYQLRNGEYTDQPPDDTNCMDYAVYSSGKRQNEYKTKKLKRPGPPNVKWQERTHYLPRLIEPLPDWEGKQTDANGCPVYSTGKDTMAVLQAAVDNGLVDMPFLKDYVRKGALDKEIGTYYVKVDPVTKQASGMLTCVMTEDHTLHHKLNHTLTVTTRLSSSDPNLQNLPRGDKSEVKAMFVSRFGADGVMVEADYSQLEVVVQGVLSGDPQLCEDLRNKVDFHCKRVSTQFKIAYTDALFLCKDEDAPDHALWKKRRTKAKNFSFQRAYGAGAPAIAAATGMTVAEVEELIAGEEAMYPGITLFNAAVESRVMASAEPFQAPDESGDIDPGTGKVYWKTYRRGQYIAPTGTRYTFRTHNAPAFLRKRGILDSFSPPELKNYPVQGTGGEFVQAVLGLLWRRFVETDFYGGKAYLVNTVHDCVWVDCHRDVLEQVCQDMKRIMESIPEFYNTRYGMNITVPFPVEIECGPNMNNLKHWVPGKPAWHHANDNEESMENVA